MPNLHLEQIIDMTQEEWNSLSIGDKVEKNFGHGRELLCAVKISNNQYEGFLDDIAEDENYYVKEKFDPEFSSLQKGEWNFPEGKFEEYLMDCKNNL